MIELDGSFGEGGGQILRTSLALALITRQPFRLKNIRARRAKPGLQPQHLMSVQAATTIGQATVKAASIGSTELVFEPGEVVPGDYHFRIGTAGATGLVLHTIYLPLALASAPSTVTIEGGTHVKASPCFHFLDVTWRGHMNRLGIGVELRMHRPGFFPRGGGLLEARIAESAGIQGLNISSSGEVTEVRGLSISAGLPASIAHRQAERVGHRLAKRKLRVEIAEETWPRGPGTIVFLMAQTQPVAASFAALGERGKSAEKVADEAVDQLESFLGAELVGLDAHGADQILLPLSLSESPSRFPVAEITQHLLTNAATIRRFLNREIVIEGCEGEAGWVNVGERANE